MRTGAWGRSTQTAGGRWAAEGGDRGEQGSVTEALKTPKCAGPLSREDEPGGEGAPGEASHAPAGVTGHQQSQQLRRGEKHLPPKQGPTGGSHSRRVLTARPHPPHQSTAVIILEGKYLEN